MHNDSYAHIVHMRHFDGRGTSKVNALLDQLSPSKPHRLTPEELNEIAINARLFVAFKNGQIIGLTCLNIITTPHCPRKAMIDDVVVDESHRGHHVAESLMLQAIQAAKKLGCRQMELTSNPSRTAAHALYLKLGFTQSYPGVFRLKF